MSGEQDTLGKFGVEVDRDAEDENANADDGSPGYAHSYRTGRCRALKSDGSARCRSPAENASDTCHMHPEESHSTVLIDAGPRRLISATSRTVWRNFENDRVRAAVEAVANGEDDNAN
jgi:hypothetical protein